MMKIVTTTEVEETTTKRVAAVHTGAFEETAGRLCTIGSPL